MIARKIKGNKIEIQTNNDILDELESYTLLDLSSTELYHLIMVANSLKAAKAINGKIYITYSHNDLVDILWESLVREHEKLLGSKFKNLSLRYDSPLDKKDIVGYLFRNQRAHSIIYIDNSSKTTYSKCSINMLAINQTAMVFFLSDLIKSGESKGIDSSNGEFYHYWSTVMTNIYLKNTNQED